MTLARELLQKYWKHDSFRDPQEEIIQSVIDGKDTIALLPTGGGKSICYQIPGIAKEGICIVISPLISLMRDQVEALNEKGIKAISLQGKLQVDEIVSLFDNLKFGSAKFLYLSPERLQSPIIIHKIQELNVNCIAVDEAHCISEWGHDFRPSYRQIKNIRQYFPETNIIALTATATKKVVKDIEENLELQNVQIYKKSFFRENLAYQIFTLENKSDRLFKILNKNSGPIIIYVNSRKKTEELARYINTKGFNTVSYHGGMSSEDKMSSFNLWMSEERPIIVATNAFGMGIDKSNVRVVVHMDLPNSIENYIQEAGRGGRDGNKAFSVVLQNEHDISIFEKNTLEKIPDLNEIKEVHKRLYTHFQIAKGERLEEAFEFNLERFCNQYQFKNKKVTTVLHILKNHGVIDLNHQFDKKSTIQIIISSKELHNFTSENQLTMQLIELLLRSYGNIFYQKAKISEFILAKKLKTTSTKVKKILSILNDKEIIEYKEASTHHDLFFLLPREDDKTINRYSKSIKTYLDQQRKKAKNLIQFIRNNDVCRSQQVLSYFGESFQEACGMCDVCLQNKRAKKPDDLTETLISLFKEHKELSKTEILQHLDTTEEAILIHLRNLLRSDMIGLTEDNKLFFEMRDLRIVFMGTPDFAVAILDRIISDGLNVVGVITAPDKPAGRGRKLNESAVKKYAKSKGLHLLQPTNLKSPDFLNELESLQANLQVVVAFRMLPKAVWSLPEYGTFNLHASLLPDYRGAAPIHWAIINGEEKTGVTTFFIDEKIDTGAMILKKEVSIHNDETVGELHDRLMHLGAQAVSETIDLVKSNTATTTLQPESETKIAPKLHSENCRVDWNDTIDNIYNHIRGLNPFPAAWSEIQNGEERVTLKIYKARKEMVAHEKQIGTIITTKKEIKVAVNGGYIFLDELKLSGKKKLDAVSLLNGYSFLPEAKML